MSTQEILAMPFRPFSVEVWVILIVMILACSWVLYFTEEGPKNELIFSKKHGCQAHYLKTFYWSFLGLMGGSHAHVHSAPARLAHLGFQFFVVIMVASYTAHLAVRSHQP